MLANIPVLRRLLALDLIKLQLAADANASRRARALLQARRREEERALLRAGPWQRADQLPRDYVPGLSSRPWWSLSDIWTGETTAALLVRP